ncbi:MAG: hypothetical protein LBD93_00395 [Treponema sp.]|jgi:predicted oxidoreductase|nr:hypothetical protein [Treponema sp.]
MSTITVRQSGLQVPAIVVGCMRINKRDTVEAEGFIKFALERGACFFDHPDIYGAGDCETRFAQAIGTNPKIREAIQFQCLGKNGTSYIKRRETACPKPGRIPEGT